MNDSGQHVFYQAVLAELEACLPQWSLVGVLDAVERIREDLGVGSDKVTALIRGESGVTDLDVVVMVPGYVIDRNAFAIARQSVLASIFEEDPEPEPSVDTGRHYRYVHRVAVTQEDAVRGFVEVKLDPYRIADIYDLGGGPREHVVKKGLRGTTKGDSERDLVRQLRDALDRWDEMLDEDDRLAGGL